MMMSNFSIFMQRLLTVSSEDSDDARRRRSLNILLLGLECLLIVAIAVSLFTLITRGAKGGNTLTFWGSVFMFIGTIVVYLINRYWSGVFAAILFLLLLVTVISFSDTPEQLSSGRSLFVFIIPIAMASLILRPSATFFFAALGGSIISVFSIAQGRLPNIPAVLGYFLVAFISWLASRNLEQAIHDLQRINANLDKLVEQKTQELATSLSRELLLAGRNQAILNSIADGVIVFDANNEAILANPALSHLTGIALNDLMNRKLGDFLQTEQLAPASRNAMTQLIEHPEETTPGLRIEWGNKTLSMSIARVQGALQNENIGIVAVLRDFTREAELEKMKDAFIAMVSHELRTPLNAILGYAEMIREAVYGPVTENQKKVSNRIMNNTQRLLAIVGDLLDQAQIQSGKLKIITEPCKPAELLENLQGTMEKMAHDKGIKLSVNLDQAMPEIISGDSHRLQQILINLTTNAIKFTDEGEVNVSIKRQENNTWQVRVADSGKGIAEDDKKYIFDSFRQVERTATRQHGGVGLGLSITKQLAERMDGGISVESQVNAGSIFIVTLPLITIQE